MPSVTLSRLTYTGPDGQNLFSNLDLSFGTGRTGLVGRNGVGKTTLLRLITGELTPASGSLNVVGRVGLLRQSVQPGPDETIADLFGVRAGLDLLERAMAGSASAEELADADWTLEARLAEALDALALDVVPESLLSTLSGGQRTRAALAALVFDVPDLILLDEPTSALDLSVQAQIIDLLRKLQDERGLSYLFISHDLKVVRALCHRVMVMQHGKIVEQGPVSEVLTNPATDYTRRLVRAAFEIAA